MAPDQRGGRDLLAEWRRLMDSVVTSMTTASGRASLPRELLAAMQRQLELAQDLIEREGRVQRDLAGRLTAPIDAAFDLLEESAVTLRRQAESLQAAGRALEEAASLMKRQAELFERTIVSVRAPADRAKAVAGVDRRRRGSGGRDTKPGGRNTKPGGRNTKPSERKTRPGGRKTKPR
jgi:hypothetical protein